MGRFEFKCDQCSKGAEMIMSYDDAKEGFICDCGGHFEKQFSTKVSIIGTNPNIYKPGLNPEVERTRAKMSMEEKVSKGEYIRTKDGGYHKVKKGGRTK